MADKADPVVELVEEEEEEWPEAGAQNVEEAEQDQDKINNIFDHLSILIYQDTKTALSQTIQNFKKVITKQWDSMGQLTQMWYLEQSRTLQLYIYSSI